MKKVISVLLVLVVLVSLLCVPANAAETPAYVKGSVSTDRSNHYLTLTLSAAEATNNGRLTVNYDADVVKLLNVAVDGSVQDIKEETGSVTFGYADLEAIQPKETVAELLFMRSDIYKGTAFTVSVLDFNSREYQTAALDIFDVIALPYIPVGVIGGADSGSDLPFDDVNRGDWFYDAVDYVVERGYFNGTSATTFSPDGAMTRGMFVTVLGRMAGAHVSHNTNAGFTDVVPGEYYAGYVKWANENGIVLGTSATTFSPNASVTREQMAAFLYRYAKFMGMDVTASDAVMKAFPDVASVSDWAVDAMAWVTDNGVINGTSKGLEPLAYSTRAQVAQVILNFESLG